MPIGEWLLGYVGGKVVDRIIATVRGKPLVRDLNREVENWRNRLPPDMKLESSAALFRATGGFRDDCPRPALAALRNEIKLSRVPADGFWLEALFEQWNHVGRNIDNPQPFFTISPEKAKKELGVLSTRLVTVASQHENLFRPTLLAAVLEISDMVRDIGEQLENVQGRKEDSFLSLGIEFTDLQNQIFPEYQSAMEDGTAWPGESSDLVSAEDRVFQLLSSRLAVGHHSAALILLRELRESDIINADWHENRQLLLRQLAAIDKQNMHGGT